MNVFGNTELFQNSWNEIEFSLGYPTTEYQYLVFFQCLGEFLSQCVLVVCQVQALAVLMAGGGQGCQDGVGIGLADLVGKYRLVDLDHLVAGGNDCDAGACRDALLSATATG